MIRTPTISLLTKWTRTGFLPADATIDQFDPLHQGRAPACSPDGRTIAFETNRSGNGYAI
ncbi:hypothetical protein HED63_24445 [Ochrobactrum cytisi]|nr:hypothetical protein [Brucella cytisi]